MGARLQPNRNTGWKTLGPEFLSEPNLLLLVASFLSYLVSLEKKHPVFVLNCFLSVRFFFFCRHTAPCKRSWCHLDGGFCATHSTDTLPWSLRLFVTQQRFCSQVSSPLPPKGITPASNIHTLTYRHRVTFLLCRLVVTSQRLPHVHEPVAFVCFVVFHKNYQLHLNPLSVDSFHSTVNMIATN